MKPWYQSKTIWFNVGTGLLNVANETAPLLEVLDPETSERLRVLLVTMQVTGNIILRFVTNTGVTR